MYFGLALVNVTFVVPEKSTAYAAQVVTQDAGRVAMSHGMKEVLVKVKGPGMGRDSAIQRFKASALMFRQLWM